MPAFIEFIAAFLVGMGMGGFLILILTSDSVRVERLEEENQRLKDHIVELTKRLEGKSCSCSSSE